MFSTFRISTFVLAVVLALGCATAEEVSADNGAPVVLTINAPDGPMPQFLSGLREARAQNISRVVVHMINISLLNDAELLELVMMETVQLLNSYSYTSSNSEIVQCPRRCGELPEPEEPAGNGETVVVVVNAPDGPMPQTRAAIQDARAQGASRIVVHLQNTAMLDDSELLELVVLETTELLSAFNYTSRNSEIVQCTGGC